MQASFPMEYVPISMLLLSILPVSPLHALGAVTVPCPISTGSQYRCVHRSNCGPMMKDPIFVLPRCGPGGVGVCCPVISAHSPRRCGIRYSMTPPPLLPKKSDIHNRMNFFQQLALENQGICNGAFQEPKTSPLQDTSTQPSTGSSLDTSPQPIPSSPLDTSQQPNSSPPLDTNPQPNSSPKTTKLTYRIWSYYDADMKESSYEETKFNSRLKRSADSVLRESNNSPDNDRVRLYHTMPATYTTSETDNSSTENIRIYIEEKPRQKDGDYFFYEEEFKKDIFIDFDKSIHDMIHSLGEIEFICEYVPEAAEFLRKEANIECPPPQLNGKNGALSASSGNLKLNGKDKNNRDLERKDSVRSKREKGKGNDTDWEGRYGLMAPNLARIKSTLHENNITLNPMDRNHFHDVQTLPSKQQNDGSSSELLVKPYRRYDISASRGTTEDSAMASDKISELDQIKYTVTQASQNTTHLKDFAKVKESPGTDGVLFNNGSGVTGFLNEKTSDKVRNGNHSDNAFSTESGASSPQYHRAEDILGVKAVDVAGLPKKSGNFITDEYERGQPSIAADLSLRSMEKSGSLNKDQRKLINQEEIKSVVETSSVISGDYSKPFDSDSFIKRNSSGLKVKVSEKAGNETKFNREANVHMTEMASSSTRIRSNAEFKSDESAMSTITNDSTEYFNETIDTSVPNVNLNMRNRNYNLNSTAASGDIKNRTMSESAHNVSHTVPSFSTRIRSNAEFKSDESAMSTITNDSTEYFNEQIDTSVPKVNLDMRNRGYNLNSTAASGDIKSQTMSERAHNVSNHTVNTLSTGGVIVNGSILTEDNIPVELDISHAPLPEKGSNINLSTFNSHVQNHTIQLSDVSDVRENVSQGAHNFRSESLISEEINSKIPYMDTKIHRKVNQPANTNTTNKNFSPGNDQRALGSNATSVINIGSLDFNASGAENLDPSAAPNESVSHPESVLDGKMEMKALDLKSNGGKPKSENLTRKQTEKMDETTSRNTAEKTFSANGKKFLQKPIRKGAKKSKAPLNDNIDKEQNSTTHTESNEPYTNQPSTPELRFHEKSKAINLHHVSESSMRSIEPSETPLERGEKLAELPDEEQDVSNSSAQPFSNRHQEEEIEHLLTVSSPEISTDGKGGDGRVTYVDILETNASSIPHIVRNQQGDYSTLSPISERRLRLSKAEGDSKKFQRFRRFATDEDAEKSSFDYSNLDYYDYYSKDDFLASTDSNENLSDMSRTMDTSVSAGLIPNETSRAIDANVSTDSISDETSRIINTNVSTFLIPNEASRAIDANVSTFLIPNETSRAIDTNVSIGLFPNETSRTKDTSVSSGIIRNETLRTIDTNVSTSLIPNERSRTIGTSISIYLIPNETNFGTQTPEVNRDTSPSVAQATVGEVGEFYEATSDSKLLFKNEYLDSETGIDRMDARLDERFDKSHPGYGEEEGNEHIISPFGATLGIMPGTARKTMSETVKTTTFETIKKDLNTDEMSIDTNKVTTKQGFEKETPEFDEVATDGKTYQNPIIIKSERIDNLNERKFDLSEVRHNTFSDTADHVEHHTKCMHTVDPKVTPARPSDCSDSDKDCSNKLQDLPYMNAERHEARDYDMIPVLNPRYHILNPHRSSRPTSKPNEVNLPKTNRSSTLTIVYRTPQERVLQPVNVKKFAQYRFSPENDELEKKMHLAYQTNLFKKGSYSVLHLNPDAVVNNPGKPARLRRHEAKPEEMTSRRRDPQHIIGGRMEDQPWPWVVSIYVHPTIQFVCAGTLIDDHHVVSAAHCFSKFSSSTQYTVLIGSLKRLKAGETSTDPLHRVKQLFIHEGFSMDCYCNDIAILKLVEYLGPEYIPACLPQYDPAGPGDNTTILGWGQTLFKRKGNKGTISLQRLDDLTITDPNECRKIMSRIAEIDLPSNFGRYYICAGLPAGGKDACAGDSGGPLMHEDYDGLWSLIGVVSFGYKCGEPGIPGTYSRISYYLPWIMKVIALY